MSRRETPMIRAFWSTIGGTLVEEFLVVPSSPTAGARRVDAIILPRGEKRIAPQGEVSVEGQEVIVVQAKATRLGMYLMGQAFFSAELIRRFNPSTVRSVALCTRDDEVLRPLLERFPGLQVVVMPEFSAPPKD